ncbi:MAG TPA: ATP-dependent DNA ligase [Acidobacteriaceae bacterium]|nr:ATP-dependent DNA ligase [Acidobacteriaceae bacterium]
MALFLQLAELAERMAGTGSRLKKRASIAEAICAVHSAAPESTDAGLFALYLAGEAFAESDPRKINVGGALLSKAILAVSGGGETALNAAYRRHGDLGAAAYDLFAEGVAKQRHFAAEGLTLEEVATAFGEMATARTTVRRSDLVQALLRRATPLEVKYLIKLMLGDMRIGVKQSLVEEAIAAAASSEDAKVAAAEVRHAVMLEADLGLAVRRAFSGTLREARMRLFHPLGFMLASPVGSSEEAVARFRQTSSEGVQDTTVHAFLEDKYDGMRAQLHCGDQEQLGRVAIYSRNREDITDSFPELAEAFARVDCAGNGPLILDGEILAWDFGATLGGAIEQDGALDAADKSPLRNAVEAPSLPRALPFSMLGERIGRKRVSDELRVRVPIVFMAFDVLYAEGKLTLDMPLRERRNCLETIAEGLRHHAISPLKRADEVNTVQSNLFDPAMEGEQNGSGVARLILSPCRLVESADDIDRAYVAARARSNEGVMIKAAESKYQPGRRGLSWVKLKRELATLDVVITGAEYGHGKRAGLLSDYTFAVRDTSGELLNVGKAYSGLTDSEILQLTESLKGLTLEDQGHFRTVEPLIVLEVAFNNVMRSTRHASGFALRFPRILRLRPDKPVGEIDTIERVGEIYQSQVDKPAEASVV